jgi:hypothetical protein
MTLSKDWADSNYRITGLIGFGGEGKSSLARQWLEVLLSDPSQHRPDSVFWWNFYGRPNAEEFIEAAFRYMSDDKIDPSRYPSSNARVHWIAAGLSTGRYLFILDGLEVLQHQEGDLFGTIKNGSLRELLCYFCAPEHQSFCIITSRVPILDLEEFTTYRHRDVAKLSTEEGR